ncbi:glycosyltransferase [Apilactobacillus bombintestini]|uniref:Glycosyltransferase n=1 Tax=Apilactobacillus bombintestini TaxID=2419772 RepID=A0A387ASA1_9LACO|nr:glycosyltransferase [Apilactobacillus bombintestini]AYF92095.1 glycosyltransferase [Apilactobacillus bombintestini]
MTKKFLFINENIFTFNSGTEFSAMNRLKLFRKNNIDAKIITRNYNPSFHQEIHKYGINDDEVLNMYDFFQHATGKKRHHEYLRYSNLIDKHGYKIHGIDNNKSYIERLGQRVAKVSIFPLTVGEIGNVDYYDNFGNVASRDVYDYRGFKSKEIYMHPDGNIGHELILDTTGKPVMEITHMNIGNQLFPTMFKLLNYKGKTYRFNTEDDLFTFFLNEICDDDCILINDRPSLTNVVANVDSTTQKYQMLHTQHTANSAEAHNPQANLMGNLVPLFSQQFSKYKGVIVATPQQRDDLAKRYPKGKFYSIFDTAILDMPKPSDAMKSHEITYMGRMFKDKSVDELLTIIPAIKQVIPDIHLTMVGYFESVDYKKELDAIIKQLKITDNVSLVDYKLGKDKAQILSNTRVLLQTSKGEGLSMSLVEGLSYGVPEVAFDVNYGPNEIIDNDQNGYLIPNNDLAVFANRVINLLTHDDIYQRFHENAIKKAEKFSADKVMKQWNEFIKSI